MTNFIRRFYRKLLFRDLNHIYYQHFNQQNKPTINKKFLDVGSSFGFELINREKQGYSAFGIEIDKNRVKKTEERIKIHKSGILNIVADARNLPFKNGVFDLVNCKHIIEHVDDDQICLGEIFRCLKRGSELILQVPNVKNLHTQLRKTLGIKNCYTDRTHLREYKSQEIIKMLSKSGFNPKKISYKGFIFPIGFKLCQLMLHYIPLSKLFSYFGGQFPRHSAEIIVLSKKAKYI